MLQKILEIHDYLTLKYLLYIFFSNMIFLPQTPAFEIKVIFIILKEYYW